MCVYMCVYLPQQHIIQFADNTNLGGAFNTMTDPKI